MLTPVSNAVYGPIQPSGGEQSSSGGVDPGEPTAPEEPGQPEEAGPTPDPAQEPPPPPRQQPQPAPDPELEEARREADEARKEAEIAKEEAARAKEEAEEARSESNPAVVSAPPSPEETTETEPRTPEEKIRANIEETFVVQPQDLEEVSVQGGEGCKQVGVDYTTSSPTGIEAQMRQVYEAIYADEALNEIVCSVNVNAYGELTDQYGQGEVSQLQSTTIDRATADQINWKEPYMVDFPAVWTLNYVHPSVEAAVAQDQLEQAVDCAEDRGLFDVDILCP